MLRITFTGDPARLAGRVPIIIAALRSKMQAVMFQLQANVVGVQIPKYFPNGAPRIASTIRADEVKEEGTLLTGEVHAGGPQTTKRTKKSGAIVDYTAVQLLGIKSSYVIEPFDKKALAFMWNAKRFVLRRVTHPPMAPKPFMSDALVALEPEIILQMQAAFRESAGGE